MIDYPKKVLLATEGTGDSVEAAYAAAALADRGAPSCTSSTSGTRPRQLPPGLRWDVPPIFPATRQLRRAASQEAARAAVEEIRGAGRTVTVAHLKEGRPAPEIVALAADLHVDLVVVGSGSPRAVIRAVATITHRATLGRVSDAIVRTAHCPVLVIRGEITRATSDGSERRRG